jgi:hypothetical protein
MTNPKQFSSSNGFVGNGGMTNPKQQIQPI